MKRRLTRTYPTAERELTEKEIRLKFGSVIDQAEASFHDDPAYLVSMVEQATRISSRRERWGTATAV